MKTDLNITKRTGHSVPLDIQKIHKVVGFACEGLTGVSSSLVQMNAGIQFADGITSREIQDLLVRSANDLITLEQPNYQYVAARLLLYGIYKDVYGGFDKTPLIEMIKKNIDRKVYDSAIQKKIDCITSGDIMMRPHFLKLISQRQSWPVSEHLLDSLLRVSLLTVTIPLIVSSQVICRLVDTRHKEQALVSTQDESEESIQR